ncbi:MAG: hypothetical protein NTY09_06060 [bacterium]|nr:hypothetical protein [bacterium]
MTSSKEIKNPGEIDWLERARKSKLAHRVALANLPFEDKIRIVVELQKIDNELAKATGRKTGQVWEI